MHMSLCSLLPWHTVYSSPTLVQIHYSIAFNHFKHHSSHVCFTSITALTLFTKLILVAALDPVLTVMSYYHVKCSFCNWSICSATHLCTYPNCFPYHLPPSFLRLWYFIYVLSALCMSYMYLAPWVQEKRYFILLCTVHCIWLQWQ